MLLVYVFALFVAGVTSECSSSQTQINEGLRTCCYYDTKGIPTIGVGFNLQRTDAASVMARYNLRLDDVINDCKRSTKKACLTTAQATEIFNNYIYPEASRCATDYASAMPVGVHAALTDVAFAGCGTLKTFVQMKKALDKKQWQLASEELKNSKWCKDVKSTRCGLDAACIAAGK